MKLLILEEDSGIRLWLSSQAAQSGVELQFATDHSEALTLASQSLFDGAFFNISTCCPDPSSMGHQIRSVCQSGVLPLFFFSTSTAFTAIAKIAGDSVDGHIARPFNIDDLVQNTRVASA
jgi:CheY-like chemotaxis protein